MQFSYKQCKAFPQVAEFLNSTEEILLMLKWCFPCQSKTYEPYSEQLVNLGCVLFCLLEISYFSSANYVLYKRSKILHYSICGALQVYLDVWQSAIMCHQVGFFAQSAFQAWFCIFPLSEPDTIHYARFSQEWRLVF